MVTLNGFDIEENPQGGLQLTSVPVSKKTTFGVRLLSAACFWGGPSRQRAAKPGHAAWARSGGLHEGATPFKVRSRLDSDMAVDVHACCWTQLWGCLPGQCSRHYPAQPEHCHLAFG